MNRPYRQEVSGLNPHSHTFPCGRQRPHRRRKTGDVSTGAPVIVFAMKTVIFFISDCQSQLALPLTAEGDASIAVHTFSALEKVIDTVRTRQIFPDWLILFQDRPGQFSQADRYTLHRLTPLTRWLVVHGPWCESEPRTGTPLPGVLRLSWSQWRVVAKDLLQLLQNETNPLSALPPTAGEEELHLACSQLPIPSLPDIEAPLQIALIGTYPDELLWIRQMLERWPVEVLMTTPEAALGNWHPVRAAIYDVQAANADELRQIRRLIVRSYRASPRGCGWVLLAGFPICEDYQFIQYWPRICVLPKPTQHWDLIVGLRSVLHDSTPART